MIMKATGNGDLPQCLDRLAERQRWMRKVRSWGFNDLVMRKQRTSVFNGIGRSTGMKGPALEGSNSREVGRFSEETVSSIAREYLFFPGALGLKSLRVQTTYGHTIR